VATDCKGGFTTEQTTSSDVRRLAPGGPQVADRQPVGVGVQQLAGSPGILAAAVPWCAIGGASLINGASPRQSAKNLWRSLRCKTAAVRVVK